MPYTDYLRQTDNRQIMHVRENIAGMAKRFFFFFFFGKKQFIQNKTTRSWYKLAP